MRVIALRYLVDKRHNYKPGDVISEGTLYEQRDYYARVGSVRIENDVEVMPEWDAVDDSYTVAELQDIARQRDIPYSGLRKAELINTLNEVL